MSQTLHWYAVYTKPRNEKKLTQRLQERGIEAYVPLRRTLKQWSDRKKFVEEPMIPSYAFVRINAVQYDTVLNTPGAVRYIWFGGKPATIPDVQIESLKILTGSGVEAETMTGSLPKGSRVRVVSGPLTGFTGLLIQHAGRRRVVLQIDHLEKMFLLTIDHRFLEPAPQA